jgi:hypothetical protein
VQISIGTRPPWDWFAHRNKLKAEDAKLELVQPYFLPWKATLNRHDGLYRIIWRRDSAGKDVVDIESQQFRYRKLIQWPLWNDPLKLPAIVTQLESALGLTFHRSAEISVSEARAHSSRSRITHVKLTDESRQRITCWLAPVCDAVHFNADRRV